MDFTLPEHVEALREEVRRFAQKEIRPHVMTWDEARSFPAEVIRQQGVASLVDALKNVPGITLNAGEGGRINLVGLIPAFVGVAMVIYGLYMAPPVD